jgi:hypothetical protein
MQRFELRGREISFVIKVDSATTDAVTGSSWTGNAYGEIIFNKASSENPMYIFQPTSVVVQIAGDGVIDQANNYTVVQDANTGFVGVKGANIAASSIIAVSGYFVKFSADADAITKNILSDSPNKGYGDGGAGNEVSSALNGL